jgi:RNA polymerase sigma-54 factor
MVFELKQSLKLTQQILITPQLQQAIKLLQLSRIELEEYIAAQIEENPVLELEDAGTAEADELLPEIYTYDADLPASDRVLGDLTTHVADIENAGATQDFDADRTAGTQEQSGEDDGAENFDDSVISGDSDYVYTSAGESKTASNLESYTRYATSLVDFLVEQVREVDFSPQEREIALYIIGNLTNIGYLDLDCERYCSDQGIDPELFAGVLDTVQRFDPPGIAARDLAECLLLQVRRRKIKNPLLETLINVHLKELGQRSLAGIARELKIDVGELDRCVDIIKSLEPRPARQFVSIPTQTVVPDVKAVKLSGQWQVVVNGEGLPNLRINALYEQLSKEARSDDDKAYWQEKLKAAQWLIRSVQQRQKTIYRVAECIVARQRDFFELGSQGLKPMILKDVAHEIGMHESTISRVTTHKYITSTRGTFELKYFFNNAVQGTAGEEYSSEAVKETIRDLLAHENSFHPYSDEKIGSILQERGIKLARRTVAKYRDQLGVLSSQKRKKYKEVL